MSQKYEKLRSLLQELFQLDQPDLDFGIYRIMHAKADEVMAFLDRDLLPQVKEAFASYKTSDKAEIEVELATAVEQAKGLGVDPESTQKVKDLRARLSNEAVDINKLEGEVYDHLFGFFRRYYSEGDFLSKRVYKEGVYALPYEGEEVKLHWANADQYYIKTSEYLRDYAFRLNPDADETNGEDPMRVHFRLRDVAEGEHGNVKEGEGKTRVFILAADNFIALEDGEDGKELVIDFEYRPATLSDWPAEERDGQKKPPAQDKLKEIAERRVLAVDDAALLGWINELRKTHVKANGEPADYSRLRANLNRYTGRNTFDYFIHKDLGGFLRRELDFYIKNEVMHLDDIESDTAPRVEQYLSKIKVIRSIAHKIIDFLAQLEDFQKKLWLKKKFVVETSYLIRVGIISEEFYPEIAANDAQREEWVRLLAIDEVNGDLNTPAYSDPLTIEFLRAFSTLMVDSRFFTGAFMGKLLESFADLNEISGGELVHSENFQALALLRSKYNSRFTCIYTDPPYNSASSEILYKNNYKHSSWITLMNDRLAQASRLAKVGAAIAIAIDDNEVFGLLDILNANFGNNAETVIVRSNPAGRSTPKGFSLQHEYALFAWNTNTETTSGKLEHTEEQASRYDQLDATGPFEWVNFRKHGGLRSESPQMYFPIFIHSTEMSWRLPDMSWDDSTEEWILGEDPVDGELLSLPNDEHGQPRRWKWAIETLRSSPDEAKVRLDRSGTPALYIKARKPPTGVTPPTIWDKKEYSATDWGTRTLKDLFGRAGVFDYPKAVALVEDCLRVCSLDPEGEVLDFFGGSGTTAHAVISLNRADRGTRRFTIVEMGDHFENVLVPRVQKVTFAPTWRGGKPISLPTEEESKHSPGFLRVLRLESYEDSVNNVEFGRSQEQEQTLFSPLADGADGFREQYMLRYMLDVESRDSQSLLNIEQFADPTAYNLKVKRPGSDESREVNVDMIETFNWLIGLTVQHITAPRTFSAAFKRDDEKRLQIDGRLKQDAVGPFWFRTVTGTMPDGRKTLVVWRKLTGDAEQDNLVLDTWLKDKLQINPRDLEFDLIYVNGDNNLENLRATDETWKVRLIEEDFHRLMFDTEDA